MCDQLKVSGTNLLNVYKLIFKVSHDNKNDKLFLEENFLGKSRRTFYGFLCMQLEGSKIVFTVHVLS